MSATHSQKLERWLGTECVELLSQQMRGWYGPPIAVAGVPGQVYACGDGDFCGPIKGGYFGNLADFSRQRARRILREWSMRQRYTAGAGFSSLSDLISEATAGGKSQQLLFSKAPTTGTTAGNAVVARNIGTLPAARGVGGASGTGVACTSSTTGALMFANPTGGDTTHITNITVQASSISSLLLFDCLWDMTHNHATALGTAVDASNRPTRYQTAALAPGNFISSEVTTALSATAHNITITYVDQDGNTEEAAPLYAAAVSAAIRRTNTPAGTWFVTLNTGDTGARYITNIAQSTITSVTGVSTFFIGHPLALCPCPIANVPFIYDGINSAFNLERVYDSANLSFMTPSIATAGTITYTGLIRLVSG
jgi:hypothetical protein